MGRVVLDANVLVGYLDESDNFAAQATELVARLEAGGVQTMLLDFLVAESLSAICRRVRQRKTPPDLHGALHMIRDWRDAGRIKPISEILPLYFDRALDVIDKTGAVLNFNDALLVLLQRDEEIGDVASFDRGFDLIPDFRRIS